MQAHYGRSLQTLQPQCTAGMTSKLRAELSGYVDGPAGVVKGVVTILNKGVAEQVNVGEGLGCWNMHSS